MKWAFLAALLSIAPARNPDLQVLRGFHDNGQLQFERWYTGDPRAGVLHGRSREWLADGTLYREMNYEHGHEAGLQQLWYDDGSVRAAYIVKNGRRYGLMGAKGCAE